ncbi:MAG: SUMF1/EgtB/PvdO family nonheme iron enzyme, partial [Chloroflexota bacterium]|nr:SUMF1/EgtB/PvdO family nonheme iron enzyme [Chloroflexota bacterium]
MVQRGIIIGVIGLLFGALVVGVGAQADVSIIVFTDSNSLTVYVPGNQVVSLAQIGFEITYSQTRVEIYYLEDYFETRFDLLRAPLCLRLVYPNDGDVRETECPSDRTISRDMAAANVFWYDRSGGNARIVTLFQGGNYLDLCANGAQGCAMTYIPPSWTPTLTPASTSAPSATALPTDKPTDAPVFVPTDTPPSAATLDIRAAAVASVTAASAQTLTALPTATPTPTFTLTPSPDLPATQAAISTEIVATAQAQDRLIAQEAYIAGLPFTGANADWLPIIRAFDGVEMALVPVGCFLMGSAAPEANDNEQPVHEVCIDTPFWIDVTEVTQAQFAAFGGVAANDSYFTGDQRPVETISWYEAYRYCDEQRGMRLPSEAVWEYAARGPDALIYPWGNEFIAANVVYSGSSGDQTANVGSLPAGASWVGALDLSGNVLEWVSTIYDQDRYPYPYRADDGREDIQDANNARVVRGGSW